MSEPSNTPAGPDGEKPHLKFKRDVLPKLTRRSEPVLRPVPTAEKHTLEETDSLIKWIGLAIMVVVVAAAVALVTNWRPGASVETAQPVEPSAAELLELDRQEVRSIAKQYLASSTVIGRLKHVRHAERVAPLMKAYDASRGLLPLETRSFDRVEPYPIDGLPFWYAVVNTPDSREILLLEKTDEGFMVDWETHVGHNPVSPDAYVRERPRGRLEFRVYVSPDDYYAGLFHDRGNFLAARLEFAESKVYLIGYIERKSADFSRFLKLVDQRKQVPLILSLEWPTDDGVGMSTPPQVKIEGLVAERWVIVGE